VVLNDVIANLTKMLKRVLRENIDLQCHYAAPLPYVQADTSMMEQIILNLVVNARDAMPGGGQLRVATEHLTLDAAYARANPGARAGEFVCLLVSDTGTGIAPEVLPRIFEPFFTTKDVGKGTGLGLATVYGIVQQHQGWIEVASQVGKGSTFKVFLPAIPTPARPAVASEAGADIRGGKETILLVEDEHAVRMATRRVLESKGYAIREATSAREALELWRSHAAADRHRHAGGYDGPRAGRTIVGTKAGAESHLHERIQRRGPGQAHGFHPANQESLPAEAVLVTDHPGNGAPNPGRERTDGRAGGSRSREMMDKGAILVESARAVPARRVQDDPGLIDWLRRVGENPKDRATCTLWVASSCNLQTQSRSGGVGGLCPGPAFSGAGSVGSASNG
jgi:CheY-like chemotaxis protein